MITKIKIFNTLAGVFAMLVILLAGSYFYSAFLEEPYLSYKNMPFAVPGVIVAGGPAISPVMRCSSASTTQAYTTTRNFQKLGANQAPFILPSIDITVEPGCSPATSRMNVVPDNAVPGFYRFSGVATVRGLFVDHQVHWNTDFFEVVEKPKGDKP